MGDAFLRWTVDCIIAEIISESFRIQMELFRRASVVAEVLMRLESFRWTVQYSWLIFPTLGSIKSAVYMQIW